MWSREGIAGTGIARVSPRALGIAARAPLFVVLAVPGLSACRSDMFDQPRYEPLEESDLFPDGASARQSPKGTVPRDDPRLDQAFYAGLEPGGTFVTTALVPLSREVLSRGQERYGVFCSPCHGLTGDGNGMIVLRGFKRPPTFHEDRLRLQPIGYFVNVITAGFGTMPSYAHQVPPRDRWAIAAYLGALQLSQSASVADLPPEDRAKIEALR